MLLDLILDEMTVQRSWQTLDEIVALARPAPVGVISAWGTVVHDSVDHGLAFVLLKPCSRDQLFEAVATALAAPPLDAAREQVLRSYFSCIERGTYDELGKLCTDDVVYRLPGEDPRFAHEVRGRDAFLGFTAKTFEVFAEPRFELRSLRALPAGALVEYDGMWREGDSSRTLPGAVMLEFRDQLIAGIHVRVDPDEIR